MSRATQPSRARQAGFTLLEVLVTLVLLGAAIAAIGSLSSVGQRGNRAVVERTELAQVARRLVNELTERSFAGGSSGAADGYVWRINVEQMAAGLRPPDPGAPPDSLGQQPSRPRDAWAPFRVIVRVRGPSGATAEIVTVRLGKVAS